MSKPAVYSMWRALLPAGNASSSSTRTTPSDVFCSQRPGMRAVAWAAWIAVTFRFWPCIQMVFEGSSSSMPMTTVPEKVSSRGMIVRLKR